MTHQNCSNAPNLRDNGAASVRAARTKRRAARTGTSGPVT
jgi:hypothetical protein